MVMPRPPPKSSRNSLTSRSGAPASDRHRVGRMLPCIWLYDRPRAATSRPRRATKEKPVRCPSGVTGATVARRHAQPSGEVQAAGRTGSELPVPPSWPTAVHGMPSPPAATAPTSAPGALGSRQSVQVIVLAGAGGLVGAVLGALEPPPVQPAAAVAATSTMTHRRTAVTFAPYRRPPGQRGQQPVDHLVGGGPTGQADPDRPALGRPGPRPTRTPARSARLAGGWY